METCAQNNSRNLSQLRIHSVPSAWRTTVESLESFQNDYRLTTNAVIPCPGSRIINRLAHHQSDIIIHSGELNYQELIYWKDHTSQSKMPVTNHISQYCVCVVINSRLPHLSLTTHNLKLIIAGKLKNWSSLNGPAQKIIVVRPPYGKNSSDIIFKNCLFQDTNWNMDFIEKQSMLETIETVSKTPGSLGFFLHLTPGNNEVISSSKKVRLLNIAPCNPDGNQIGKPVLPTVITLANGDYPLSMPLVAVYHSQAESHIKEFVQFLRSEEGAKVQRNYALFPEYDRQKNLSDTRIDSVKNGEGEEIAIHGHRSGLGIARLLGNEFVKANTPVQLKYLVKPQLESVTAFLNHEIDMLLVDEPFSKKTLEKHASQLSKYHPDKFDIGQVGVGIIVHPLNNIDWLKKEELLNIFTGQTRYWSKIQRGVVAANSTKNNTNIETPIQKFGLKARSKKNISRPVIELFQEVILIDKRMKNVKSFKSSEEVINSVSLDANSIGFINLADLDTTKTNVKLIGIVPEGKSFPETVRVPQNKEPEKQTSKNPSNHPRKQPDFIRFAQWEVSAGYPLLRTWSLYVDRRSKDIAWEFADYAEAKTKDQKWLFIQNPDDLFGGPEQVTRSLREYGLIRPTEEELFVKKTKGPKPVFTLP